VSGAWGTRLGPALQERDFALLWLALVGMGVSMQMLEVAIGWQVYSNHHSALDLGWIGLAEFLPMFALALPAGHVADRLPRRLVLAFSLVLSVGVGGGLVALSVAGVRAVAPFLGFALAAGTAYAIGTPAARALPAVLVPSRLLESAMTLRSIATQSSQVVGPALQVSLANGVSLEYQTAGSSEDPPLLMIMGYATQLIAWPCEFCAQLARGGRFVISFDNRDCGLSSKLEGEGAPIEQVIAAASGGDYANARELAAYTLSDMSDDALGLLSALGIERAHVLGASMGGMIAQTCAIEHPERLLTLTSIMSSTGERTVGQPTAEALQALLAPRPADRDGYIATAERVLLWRSKRYPELEEARALAAESYDRCFYPEGVSRQLAAMIASPARVDALRELQTPTLVIHGLDDTLIDPSGGRRTAELVPNARLLLLEDMGHDRPRPLWLALCEAILEHTS